MFHSSFCGFFTGELSGEKREYGHDEWNKIAKDDNEGRNECENGNDELAVQMVYNSEI